MIKLSDCTLFLSVSFHDTTMFEELPEGGGVLRFFSDDGRELIQRFSDGDFLQLAPYFSAASDTPTFEEYHARIASILYSRDSE